ncbi:MAG: hypothetical protein V5A28_12675 [Haloarculaceae archaeon]
MTRPSDRLAVRHLLPFSVLGGAVAAYHSWLQVTVSTLQCGVGGSFAAVLLRVFGLTVPNLSLVAFVLVATAAAGLWRLDAA